MKCELDWKETSSEECLVFVGEYLGDLVMNFRFGIEDFSINNIKIINGAFWVVTEELVKFFSRQLN